MGKRRQPGGDFIGVDKLAAQRLRQQLVGERRLARAIRPANDTNNRHHRQFGLRFSMNASTPSSVSPHIMLPAITRAAAW